MQKTIWVTGIGVASSIGLNVEDSLISFRKGKTGLGNIDILNTVHKSEFKAGEIRLTNHELMQILETERNSLRQEVTAAKKAGHELQFPETPYRQIRSEESAV